MPDRPDSADHGRADAAGKLPSARDAAPGDENPKVSERAEQSGSRRGKRRGRSTTPTPARALAKTTSPDASLEPDATEASVEVENETWTVRVLGRSGGSRDGATPLLLLGFWAPGSEDTDHGREVLTVGRRLGELSDFDLRAAHGRSGPARGGAANGSFFADVGEQRRGG